MLLPHPLCELPHGLAAVGNGIFLFMGKLGESLRETVLFREKHRVITEAVFSGGSTGDLALYTTLEQFMAFVAHIRHHTTEPCSTLSAVVLLYGHVLQFGEELADIVLSLLPRTGIAGREHPGCPAESVHEKPRIIRKTRQTCLLIDVLRLLL